MRILFILTMAFVILTLGITTSGNGRASSFLTISTAWAQDSSNGDDENTDDEMLWPFDDTGDDEQGVDEEQPADEQSSGDEEVGSDNQSSEESSGDEAVTDEEQTSDESSADVGTAGKQPAPRQSKNRLQPLPETDWGTVPGAKIPFFFLIDERDLGSSTGESKIVDLKANKYAGEILSGLSFRYIIGTGDVYLAENITALPENIRYVDETHYVGVARYDYEVAVTDAAFQNSHLARTVVVGAEVSDPNIARAFEMARREVLTKAVQNAAQHYRVVFSKEGKKEVTGTITAWEILNQGWIQADQSFYIQLRAWVAFDGIKT